MTNFNSAKFTFACQLPGVPSPIQQNQSVPHSTALPASDLVVGDELDTAGASESQSVVLATEILIQIFRALQRDQDELFNPGQGLYSCSLVCRQWQPAAYSVLYENIDIEFRRTVAIPLLPSLRANPALGKLVKSFAASEFDYKELERQIEEAVRADWDEQQNGALWSSYLVKFVRDEWKQHPETRWKRSREETLYDIISQFSNLDDLQLEFFEKAFNESTINKDTHRPLNFSRKPSISPILAHLKSVTLFPAEKETAQSLLQICTNIARLFYVVSTKDDWTEEDWTREFFPKYEFTQLQHLSLILPIRFTPSTLRTILCRILTGCAHTLQSLVIEGPNKQGYLNVLPIHLRLPRLTSFILLHMRSDITPPGKYDEKVKSSFFASSTNLQSFMTDSEELAKAIHVACPDARRRKTQQRNRDHYYDSDED